MAAVVEDLPEVGARPVAGRRQATVDDLLVAMRAYLPHADLVPARGDPRLVLPTAAWVDLEAARDAVHRAESAVALEDWPRAWGAAQVTMFTARRGFLPGEDVT